MQKRAAFILLFLMTSTLVNIPQVSSWGKVNIHPHLTVESLNLLPQGSSMHNEFFENLEHLLFGAENEDVNDVIYGLTSPGIKLLPHFWSADEGIDDPVKFVFDYPNAYQKSLALFKQALQKYEEGDYSHAFRLIGRVAHLIQDQCVPAHAHNDLHSGIPEWIPGAHALGLGDDCLEDWFSESNEYIHWTADSITEGLIEFPEEIKAKLNQGHWQSGIYYLMYTTNQLADYFASDDYDGDSNDNEGWMNYSIIERGAPTKAWHLSDNDRHWNPRTLSFEDNDKDGELSTIVRYTIPYGIRAVATLYKLFYEYVHTSDASFQVDYIGEDIDGNADYKLAKRARDYTCFSIILPILLIVFYVLNRLRSR
jgi:hypothetical protein